MDIRIWVRKIPPDKKMSEEHAVAQWQWISGFTNVCINFIACSPHPTS